MGYLSSGDSARVGDRLAPQGTGPWLKQLPHPALSFPGLLLPSGQDGETGKMISAGPFLHSCACASGSVSHCCGGSHLTAEESRACLKATQLESGSGTWIVGTWGRGKKSLLPGVGGAIKGPGTSLPYHSQRKVETVFKGDRMTH